MAQSFNASLNVNLNPASLNASTKQVSQALGRITGQASEFQKSLDASTARVFAFGATTLVLNGITQSFKKLIAVTVEVEKRLEKCTISESLIFIICFLFNKDISELLINSTFILYLS